MDWQHKTSCARQSICWRACDSFHRSTKHPASEKQPDLDGQGWWMSPHPPRVRTGVLKVVTDSVWSLGPTQSCVPELSAAWASTPRACGWPAKWNSRRDSEGVWPTYLHFLAFRWHCWVVKAFFVGAWVWVAGVGDEYLGLWLRDNITD